MGSNLNNNPKPSSMEITPRNTSTPKEIELDLLDDSSISEYQRIYLSRDLGHLRQWVCTNYKIYLVTDDTRLISKRYWLFDQPPPARYFTNYFFALGYSLRMKGHVRTDE